jgi:hypothetical protein
MVPGLTLPTSPHDLPAMKDTIRRSLEPFAKLSNDDWEGTVWPSFQREMFPNAPTTADTAQAQADASVAGDNAPTSFSGDVLRSLAGAGKKIASNAYRPFLDAYRDPEKARRNVMNRLGM